MSGFLGAIFQPLKLLRQGFHSISSLPSSGLVQPESVFLQSIRNKVRCYFPRPNEVRRVRRHGWEKRISTANGRKVIMRRLLKGRHVLTH